MPLTQTIRDIHVVATVVSSVGGVTVAEMQDCLAREKDLSPDVVRFLKEKAKASFYEGIETTNDAPGG